jgi:hypothetical protein
MTDFLSLISYESIFLKPMFVLLSGETKTLVEMGPKFFLRGVSKPDRDLLTKIFLTELLDSVFANFIVLIKLLYQSTY